MRYFFILLTASISIWLDLVFNSNGINSYFCLSYIVYLTLLYKWKVAMLGGMLCFTVLDAFFGTFSLPALVPLLLVGTFWRYNGDCTRLSIFWVPLIAALLPAIFCIIYFTNFSYNQSFTFGSYVFHLLKSVLFTVPLSIFLVVFYDWIAAKIRLVGSTEIQKEEMYSAGQ